MKLNQVRDLIAVAERGSLRSAARYLGVAQPAITRSIRELEKELDVTLFERLPKGVVLTPMGEIFLQRAKAAQCELDRAKEELHQYKGGSGGKVSVCLSTASHIALLHNTLEPFRSRYREALLDITEGLFASAEAGLKGGELDLYVGPLSEDKVSSEFIVEKLLDNERVVFCRKGHALADSDSLGDLCDADWISTAVTLRADAELSPLFQKYGFKTPRIALYAHSALTMMTAAAGSDLLTMLPKQWVQFSWAQSLLHRIKVKEHLEAPAMYMVRRASLPLTPAAEYFGDMIRRASVALEASAV
ncbi:LysR family transcriptional regulator [Pseudomaricurvus alkylphenolicus]|uniref:LysR family transcriptional regulator n=1 Tax=Pseudomaricurvus alkylphenolicus TaxID=1306991 RepID=UPI00141FCAFD|nr:LysR substrate-binding domain-containing protein [Pseudomaricurvus alkylphenolicus]NIB43407.1 LysR family transcriptional regulator [Pseudomaricurvus alkylphenolicus]